MKNLFLYLAMILCAAGLFAEEPLLNHTGNINALAFDHEAQLLYSAGEDGYLKIWDTKALDMKGSYSVSDVPLTDLVINTRSRRMVLAERRGSSRYGLLLRNLDTGEALGRVFIESRIHRLAFSPSGKMVIAAQDQKDSLLFFDAETLNRIVLPFQVTEPVLDFYINDRETAFLALTKSGTIFYYNLQDNKVIKSLKGPQNPQSPRILPGGNYLLVRDGIKLNLVSLANGKVINSTDLPDENIRLIAPQSIGSVSCCTATSRELIFYTWNYRKTGEIFMPACIIRNPEPMTAVIQSGTAFLLGYQTGSVSILGADTRNIPISSVFIPEPVSDIAVAGKTVYLATDRQIHAVNTETKAVTKVPPLNPLGRAVYLYPVGNDLILLATDKSGSRLTLIEGGTGFTQATVSFDKPTVSLLDNGDLLTVFFSDRTLRLLDRTTLVEKKTLPQKASRLLYTSSDAVYVLQKSSSPAGERVAKIDIESGQQTLTSLTVPTAHRLYNPNNRPQFTLMTREKSGSGEFFSFYNIDLNEPYSKQLLWKTALPSARLNGFRVGDSFFSIIEKKQVGTFAGSTGSDEMPSPVLSLTRPAAKVVESETELYILNTDDTVSVYDKNSLQPKGLMFVSRGQLNGFWNAVEEMSAVPMP